MYPEIHTNVKNNCYIKYKYEIKYYYHAIFNVITGYQVAE